jgi:hypothetical protein
MTPSLLKNKMVNISITLYKIFVFRFSPKRMDGLVPKTPSQMGSHSVKQRKFID